MHKYVKILLILFLVFLSSGADSLYAGDSTKANIKYNAKRSVWGNLAYDLGISLNDAGKFFTAPLRFNGKDWLYTAGIVGGTIALIAVDKQVKNKISRTTNNTYNHDFWDIPTAYGYVLYPAVFGGLLYTVGLFSGHDPTRVTGRLLLESMLYSGIITDVLKVVAGRTRPYYTDNQWDFKGFKMTESSHSFPSGHATVAFSVSTILAERIGTWWSRVLFYGTASLTAYARVLNNQHWLSDVVFGGLIGFGTSWFVLNRENEREKSLIKKPKSGGSKISLYPSLNGLSLVYDF